MFLHEAVGICRFALSKLTDFEYYLPNIAFDLLSDSDIIQITEYCNGGNYL